MKRTELEKRERELRRKEKKEAVLARNDSPEYTKPGVHIDLLFSKFRYDQEQIFNTEEDIEILEILENMKEYLPEKQWENVLRKSIKKTGVSNKEKAFSELQTLLVS